MESREIVKRCIEFGDPPRIAMDFATLPVDGKTWNFSDFGMVIYSPDPDHHQQDGTDEWGIVMETLDPTGVNFGQPKVHPLGNGWDQLDTYKFPDFTNPGRYAHIAEHKARLKSQGKYVYAPIHVIMQQALALRGMENWLMDHVLEPENLCRLIDAITNINLKMIDYYHQAGVDAVISWDDMGTNDRGFVSPTVFESVYLPRYKRITDALHERGMKFIHHCCGYVREYMDMFVEGGWDVLQLDQPTLMGIDWLGENYGGKLCFWNCVDIQKTMPKGDPVAIEDEAHHQVWAFGRYGGGFMVKAYQQPPAVGITAGAAQAQYDAFMKHSEYPLSQYD